MCHLRRTYPILLSGLLVPFFIQATYAQTTRPDVQRRIYTIDRLKGPAPRIDGRLDDPCWGPDGWTGQFTQQLPREGMPPSQETSLKITYDDHYVYMAVRAFDTEPQKIERRMARRDVFAGDVVGIALDTYFDHRTAYEFNLTAAGGKIDLMHRGDKEFDFTWDAVWDGATALEDSAWTAEMRVPLSQLRFQDKDEQVWGIHVWRWIHRFEEESQYQLLPKDAPAAVPYFGELRGIRGLKPSRRIELLPYTVGRVNTSEPEDDNPFATGHRSTGGLGLDGKFGLSSSFTVDLTVNPDFGQVEADPSVMNLTAFETFYEEKRPFFLEGSNILNYPFDGGQVFYSRRIGGVPRFGPDLSNGEYARLPETTSILSAVKLTGKTRNGLSVGILESLASRESATIASPTGRYKRVVEPMTHFLVGRVGKEYNRGNTFVGGLFTAVNRRMENTYVNDLHKAGYTAGLDFKHQWNDKTYFVEARTLFSNLTGSTESIVLLQRNAVHNYQRTDAEHLDVDSTRTNLAGFGGSISVGKAGTGRWRFSEYVSFRSPGLDLNDAGFLQVADQINQSTSLSYVEQEPVGAFRSFTVKLDQANKWDFGGDLTETFGQLDLNGQWSNYWRTRANVLRYQEMLDTRWLRGGPSIKAAGFWHFMGSIDTDTRRKLQFELSGCRSFTDGAPTRHYSIAPEVEWRVSEGLGLSTEVQYINNVDDLMYVGTTTHEGRDRYLLARIDQETANLTFRVNYNLRPDLSIQFYGQPFISTGKYSDFKVVTDARADTYGGRFKRPGVHYEASDNAYGIDESGDGAVDYTIDNPNFSFREFRSNLVLRWEYHPGSTIYLVWSQSRSGTGTSGRFDLADDLDGLTGLYPNNVFAIKLSHWFSTH